MHGRSVLAGMVLMAVAGLVGFAFGERGSDDPPQLDARSAAATERLAHSNAGRALATARRARRIAGAARKQARQGLATAESSIEQVEQLTARVDALVAQVEGVSTTANQALTTAQEAQTTAQNAQGAAANAQSLIDRTRITSAAENGTVMSDDDTAYVPLGGPQVTVDVPQSGFIEVWARVRFEADGAVALFEDGNLVPLPGQEGVCTGGGPLENALISAEGLAPITLSTPPAFSDLGLGCGTAGGQPGSILLHRTPGIHTYELRYGDVCGCDPAVFAERELRVAPRL